MIGLVCEKCGRRGQYRVDTLLERYGPQMAMPGLRHVLARCPHRHDMSNPSQIEYVDWLADVWEWGEMFWRRGGYGTMPPSRASRARLQKEDAVIPLISRRLFPLPI